MTRTKHQTLRAMRFVERVLPSARRLVRWPARLSSIYSSAHAMKVRSFVRSFVLTLDSFAFVLIESFLLPPPPLETCKCKADQPPDRPSRIYPEVPPIYQLSGDNLLRCLTAKNAPCLAFADWPAPNTGTTYFEMTVIEPGPKRFVFVFIFISLTPHLLHHHRRQQCCYWLL